MLIYFKSILNSSRYVSIGTNSSFGLEFNNRLKILNIFTWTCILFCTPYYVSMFIMKNNESAFLFVIVQLLFALSLWLNKLGYYSISKILILITTNYSVLVLNFTYGYDSGFYLYYFTSPLIVFSIFHFQDRIQSIISLSLYLSSFAIAAFCHSTELEPVVITSANTTNILFYLNSILVFCFLAVLAISFSKFHNDVSNQVLNKNIILKQNQIELEQLLKDKNILLTETHHRVKNNLAVISGMFDLQMLFENDKRINSIMTNAKNRIKSMSLVHESLYSQSIVSKIDFKTYVASLVKELKNSLQLETEVKFQLEIDDIHLELSTAIPCGLIINEIVTNCFKHAFKNTSDPKIIIQMNFNETYTLSIHDNGSGFDSENRAEQNSLGLTLIDALVNQLNGSFSYQKVQGTLINIYFKKNDDKRIENILIS